MQLQFKAKPADGQLLPCFDVVPVVTTPKAWKRSHVLKPGRLASYINSNMLGLVVARELKHAGVPSRFNAEVPPAGITCEPIGPLMLVTITIEE